MLFKELETDRLYLKNISSEDREFLLTQFSNDEVHQYLFDNEPLTDIKEADDIINFYLKPEPRSQHRWILVRKEDGTKIGTCGFHCWDMSKGNCDVGYDLYPDFWNKGYMSEAMRAIIAFAQNNMKIKHINACIYPENKNSMQIAERLGFVFNGQMKDENFRGKNYPHKVFVLDCTTI